MRTNSEPIMSSQTRVTRREKFADGALSVTAMLSVRDKAAPAANKIAM